MDEIRAHLAQTLDHTPCPGGHLRLSAERGRQPEPDGHAAEMGFAFTDDPARADVIVLNTCAVREHAEKRVYGNLGALTHTKKANPAQVICLCGCMAQQSGWRKRSARPTACGPGLRPPCAVALSGAAEKSLLGARPCLLHRRQPRLHRRGPAHRPRGPHEGLGLGDVRLQQFLLLLHRALCPGPGAQPGPGAHSRRRDRPAAEGYKDITLLGQNVNSYGKDLPGGWILPICWRRWTASMGISGSAL